MRSAVDRQDMVDGGHLHEQVLHLLQLARLLRCEIVYQTEIATGVVKLPDVILKAMAGFLLQGLPVDCAGEPAVVVDRAVAVCVSQLIEINP
jgi:hypothetical protein